MEWKMFQDFGFAGLVTGTLFFIVWRILVWVMKWVDRQADLHSKEREAWQTLLNQHTARAEEFHNQVSEAHRFQREEHKEMMERFASACLEHKEMITVLGRINGYKDAH